MLEFPLVLGVVVAKPVFIGLLAALAAAGGVVLFRADSRVESRRKEAFKLAQIANDNGFPMMNGILESYAVGDYSGALQGVGGLYGRMIDEKERKAAFRTMLETQLDKHTQDPALWEELATAIEKRKPGIKIPRSAPLSDPAVKPA